MILAARRWSPFAPVSRPASAAAGSRPGASLSASWARAKAVCGSRSAFSRAIAVLSTARQRLAVGLSIRPALELVSTAAALAGRLTGANGDHRRAAKIIEAAWERTPHPDLAAAYLRLRHGDSALDRLAKARALARIAPRDSESALTVGRAALEARDLAAARTALAPLVASDAPARPSIRACLLMADIAEAEGDSGLAREWLSRAARAPRDRAWVADSIVSDRWAPASPAGKIDAFVWRTPDERLSAPYEPPAPPRPAEVAPPPTSPTPPVLEARPVEMIEAAPAASESTPAPAPARTVASAAPPRVNGFDALKPPDDPGPHDAPARKGAYRFFSQG